MTKAEDFIEGNSIRATGRILQIDKDTMCDWPDQAVLHCRSVALYFWTSLHIKECQLPEYDDALLHAYGVWVQPSR